MLEEIVILVVRVLLVVLVVFVMLLLLVVLSVLLVLVVLVAGLGSIVLQLSESHLESKGGVMGKYVEDFTHQDWSLRPVNPSGASSCISLQG